MIKNQLPVIILLAGISSTVAAERQLFSLDDQIRDVQTGNELILVPKPGVPVINLNASPIATPLTTGGQALPNITIGGQALPKIKYWSCDHGKCNQVELLIYNCNNSTLVNLDNMINEGWKWLETHYQNLPILKTRNDWVNQRDTIAGQALSQGYSADEVITWLINQYQLRVTEIDQLGLIPKKQ